MRKDCPGTLPRSFDPHLMHDQTTVQQAWGLVVVGDDAADEVGVGGVEGGEEGIQLGAEEGGNRLMPHLLALSLLLLLLDGLLRLARVVAEQVDGQGVG